MKSILITGCNRGLGYGLIKYISENHGVKNLIATCRDKSKANDLVQIAEQNPAVKILELDVTNIAKLPEFTNQVQQILGDDGLNVLWNNAGITTKFTRLPMVKYEQLRDNLLTNTVAPILLTKTLHPLLKKAATNANKSVVVNMSSIMGSMALNKDGGFYPYRTSKAAINAATKSMSVDLKNDHIISIALHPGWVKTDMGGASAPLTVDQSVGKMYELILSLNDNHNGKFLQYDGTELPW